MRSVLLGSILSPNLNKLIRYSRASQCNGIFYPKVHAILKALPAHLQQLQEKKDKDKEKEKEKDGSDKEKEKPN